MVGRFYIFTLKPRYLLHSREEIAGVQKELQTKRLLLLAESDKVIQCERRLYNLERCVEQMNGQNMKLKLKLEELQLKYEPGKTYFVDAIRAIPFSKVTRRGPESYS